MIRTNRQNVQDRETSYVNLILSVTNTGTVIETDEELYELLGISKKIFINKFQNNLVNFVRNDQQKAFYEAIKCHKHSVFIIEPIYHNDKSELVLLIGSPCKLHDGEMAINATLLEQSELDNNINSNSYYTNTEGKVEQTTCKENDTIKDKDLHNIIVSCYETIDKNDREYYHCDRITGLPNETGFYEIVEKILKRNSEEAYAIVYTDINCFGYVNETYGYLEGNRLLAQYAGMMTQEKDFIKAATRLLADNFVFLVVGDSLDEVADRICSMNKEFSNQSCDERIAVKLILSSGIARIDSKTTIRCAIDNANIARKSIKANPHTSCGIFTKQMQEKILWETHVNHNMEYALKNNEFQVYYQPKIQLKTGKMVGAEALVRWITSTGEIIPPMRFIPIFEKNGFIEKLDFFVYEEVCRFLRDRLDHNLSIVPVSVNVSGAHLSNPYFVQHVITLVEQYKLPFNLIELELTESVCIENSSVALEIIKQFREKGFVISIDDFGSGYSSLNLLKDMTTDIIKLDSQFFRSGKMHQEEKIIISSIVHMAKQLNMKVLSEGVETSDQSEFLKEISCDMAQGYFFAKPMPISKFEELLN